MYEALLKATPEYQKIAASFAKPGPAALFGLPDRKSTRLNSSHMPKSRMPSSA